MGPQECKSLSIHRVYMQNLNSFKTGESVYIKFRDTSGSVVYGSDAQIKSKEKGMCVVCKSGRVDYFKDIDGFYVEVTKSSKK